jgi:UDP-2,3-diacylglucosamine pyrophosphatase LpxH
MSAIPGWPVTPGGRDSSGMTGRPTDRVVRSLFISDTHLGCRHAQAEELLDFLQRYEPQYVYLVGDFLDGWKLSQRWRWTPTYDRILQRLLELRRRGASLCYAPGNHDNFLRAHLGNYFVVDVRDRFVHRAADGRRYLVLHGDQFDTFEKSAPWLSFVASFAYDVMLGTNWLCNKLRGKQHDPYAFCGAIKAQVKALVRHVSDFETQLVDAAHQAGCDGIICGHIHAPRISQLAEIHYCNTGDWVENCTALVEYEDGGFELLRWTGEVIAQLPALPRSAVRPSIPEYEHELVTM